MVIRLVLKILLLASTIICVSGETCPNGGIIQLITQKVIKDTYPIENSAFDCTYRCHPSNEANGVIDSMGIESMFVVQFCTYYGMCQVSLFEAIYYFYFFKR